EPVAYEELVEAPHRDHGARRRGRTQRGMVGVALTQPDQEVSDGRLGDARQGIDPVLVEELDVTAQVTAVGGERVGGQSAFDAQVVEVGPDRTGDLVATHSRPRARSTS